MIRINVLLLVGSLLSFLPFSLGQVGLNPCNCNYQNNYFQFQSATICNWQWYDQWEIWFGNDFPYTWFIPFGGCSGPITGIMKCFCIGMLHGTDENGDFVKVMYQHPLIDTKVWAPNAIIISELPWPAPCNRYQPQPPPDPFSSYWHLFQQIDINANKIGEFRCILAPFVAPWPPGLEPSPTMANIKPYTLPPGWGWGNSDGNGLSARAESSSSEFVSESSPEANFYNSTEWFSSINEWMDTRRQNRTREAELAWAALDSTDPRVDKMFVRSMIMQRNLTRPEVSRN